MLWCGKAKGLIGIYPGTTLQLVCHRGAVSVAEGVN